ncbi:MAG: nitrogenase iron-molybdenum cofactor biosynthesis protein NifE [Candidatus Tectomicrobia bacterium]|uniref:Nitrogenase iron-molybdenum cofactor biosynthesis protein NifE n=1 Tax=Tectimicrobiota bacterium TaxID=2528274 RepID=A0A933GL47_UNCTE|nr:nitrogenase iron-molybdenum cofactor biosynthesis protein NifE [Candidatus Tectomicrobia bacterium]
MTGILEQRKPQIYRKGQQPFEMACERKSLAGSVSQRACVFCGSRVVLYPIADAVHLVHGPIGCAVYTWDIRGALSSGPQLHRLSFSTDLREADIIYGGEKKLQAALMELIEEYQPRAAFVYSTCIVGIIGDDVDAICRIVSKEKGIPVLSVHSEGFKGTKKDGYRTACEALFKLVGTDNNPPETNSYGINILGDFNLAGEIWIIKRYFEKMGIKVVASITGDGRVDQIRGAHRASLNLVQCSGSMMHLANMLKEKYGIPFKRVSYFGIEDMAQALYDTAEFFEDPVLMHRTETLVRDEVNAVYPKIREYRRVLEGKKAAIYVGGAFKAFSLVKALKLLGMRTVMVGSQTGTIDDYQQLREMCYEGTIIVDDSNPLELSNFLQEKKVDLFIGGVKERPIAYKLGVGFCDHNHERKEALAGFEGMLNFAREVYSTVMSPVWQLVPRRIDEFKNLGIEGLRNS